jgi:hypothetical protein
MQKDEVGSLSCTLHKKNQLKLMKDLQKTPNCKAQENIGKRVFFFFDSFGNSFLLMIPKAQATKPDIDK